MEFKEFNKQLKLNGTLFDRRRKLSRNQIEEIKELYNTSDITISELADKFKVSRTAINYHLSNDAYKVKLRINRMACYYSKSEQARCEDSKRWKISSNKYKQELYNTLINN